MRLAASQIAWEEAHEQAALGLLQAKGFTGLEIAPTRVAGQHPYERPEAAAHYAQDVQAAHGLSICSMQSIWYGQSGQMFGAERGFFLDYTKAAIRFAAACGAGNLVFGCPKNRVLPEGMHADVAIPFFCELGEAAAAAGTVLALEANPALYGTNFINTTPEAFAMAEKVGSAGFRVNLDFGTLVANGETVDSLRGHIALVNHVHISEPELAPVQKRPQHRELAALLREEGYAGWVSLEMRACPLDELERTLAYVAEVFA